MKSRGSFWWTWLSASVPLFIGQRLTAMGEIIARELERSYASATDIGSSSGKRGRSPVAFLRQTKKHGSEDK
jgi:hypothetical protein